AGEATDVSVTWGGRSGRGCLKVQRQLAVGETGRGRVLAAPPRRSLPAARGSVSGVRASVVPATAELCAVATHRDVFKEGSGRSEQHTRGGEWLVAVVPAVENVRVQQTKPLEVDARHAAGLRERGHRSNELSVMAVGCIDHEQRIGRRELAVVGDE